MKAHFYVIPFLFFVNFLSAQTVGISLQAGSEYRRFAGFNLETTLNNSDYFFRYTLGIITKGFIGVNLYREDDSGLGFLYGYSSGSNSISDLNSIDSSGTRIIDRKIIGKRIFQNHDVHIDRFLPLAKRNEKLNILWGFGINIFFHEYEIDDIKISNFYNKKAIYSGVVQRFLGKLIYKSKWIWVEGVVGLNLADFSFVHTRNFDPDLTVRQQTNRTFDFDIHGTINGRLGITIPLNLKKKVEKNIEKTHNE